MNKQLNQELGAYDRHHLLDNRVSLNWYPKRVSSMATTGSMLELGLGHGYSSRHFAEAFKRYIVVDGSQEMIDRFRNHYSVENIDIVHAFFEDFETEEKFDAIGMGFVLEHVDDPALVLKRYAKFLAPGGAIFIAVPNAESLHRRLGYEAGMLPDMQTLSRADLDFGHKRYFNLASLRELVESVGLEVQQTEGLFLKPITTQQMEDLSLSEPVLQALLKVGVDYPELSNSILLKARYPQ